MQTNDKNPIHNTLAGKILACIPILILALILACIPILTLAGNQQDYSNERMPPMQLGMMPPPESMPPMGMQPSSPLDELNLSESQQKQIDNLMQAQMKVIIEKQRLIRKTVLALHEVSAANDFDAVKAKSLADAHGKAVGELAFLHAEMQAKVAAVLTEAQRRQMQRSLSHASSRMPPQSDCAHPAQPRREAAAAGQRGAEERYRHE